MSYYTIPETALIVGLCQDTVRKKVRLKEIEHFRESPLNKILIPQNSVEELIRQQANRLRKG